MTTNNLLTEVTAEGATGLIIKPNGDGKLTLTFTLPASEPIHHVSVTLTYLDALKVATGLIQACGVHK